MQRLHDEGKLHYSKKTGYPRQILYLEDSKGVPLQDMWSDISSLSGAHNERLNYATQKPEALLERILKASSDEGDLVLDCFCGSGTTAAVAEKLGRRWITCDLGRFAVHTARKRLLAIPGVRPFEVQNLGRYERSAWQAAEFGDSFAVRQEAYHKFILRLFKGEARAGNAYVHGTRKGRLVHVGAVDAPVTLADIRAVAAEARRLVGTGAGAPTELGIDVLFWDLAFEVNEAGVALAKEAGVNLRVYKIPHEVMEKKAVDGGDIQFHEMAALGVTATAKGRTAKVELTEFLMSLDYVPDMVFNDEAHHTHDEGNAWNRAIRALHAEGEGIVAQLDFSATPRHQKGTLFSWTIYDYPLKKAILDNIVKRPLKGVGKGLQEAHSDVASIRYQAYLTAGVERWKEYAAGLAPLGRKPVLFVMANKTTEADDIADYLRRTYPTEFGGERTKTIHTDLKGDVAKGDLEEARKLVREVDDPKSPVRAIVSVLMLREGWDVQSVTVVVGLRPYTAAADILPEQTIGRGLRLMFRELGIDYQERVDVIGTKKFMELIDQLEKDEDLELETFDVDKDKVKIVTIFPDPEKVSMDIAVPRLTPILARKRTLAEEIAALDVMTLGERPLPKKAQDLTAGTFFYEGIDVVTNEAVVRGEYKIPVPQTSSEVVSHYAKRIAADMKLPGQFAALAPKVAEFLRHRAFGETVDLDTPEMLKAISSNVASFVTIQAFGKALRPLITEELVPKIAGEDRLLSQTEPFPHGRQTVDSPKTVFNLCPADNGFEETFAKFCHEAADVARFSKLPKRFGFAIEYTDSSNRLRFYEPDFVVVTSWGENVIVETKGQEDVDVAFKDRAARLWCEYASVLKGETWRFVKVRQHEFKALQPDEFADLMALD